jgi:hypothetical protein
VIFSKRKFLRYKTKLIMEEANSSKAQGGHPTVPFTEKRLQLNDLEILHKGFEELYNHGIRKFD